MKLEITDSCLNGKEIGEKQISLARGVINKLRDEFKEKKVEIISLIGQSRKKENFENQPIIWYEDISFSGKKTIYKQSFILLITLAFILQQ
jgi:hypothetical protein